MADAITVQRFDGGSTPGPVRGGVDNALVTQDWIDAMNARGFGWMLSVGTATTPIAGGGAGTVFDPDQPILALDVPFGKTMIIIRTEIALETPLLAADDDEVESTIFVDVGALSGAGETSGTALQWVNARMDSGPSAAGPGVTGGSANTTNLTAAPTQDINLSHKSIVGDVQTAASAFWGDYLHLYEPKYSPYIVGPSTYVVDWAGTVATSGYMHQQVVVIPTNKISDLT